MVSSVFEKWENVPFYYLSIVGDESLPKASKTIHVMETREGAAIPCQWGVEGGKEREGERE